MERVEEGAWGASAIEAVGLLVDSYLVWASPFRCKRLNNNALKLCCTAAEEG
jgi:hypothetical protein